MTAYHFTEELKAHLESVVVDELFGNDAVERIVKVEIVRALNDQLKLTMDNGHTFTLTITGPTLI